MSNHMRSAPSRTASPVATFWPYLVATIALLASGCAQVADGWASHASAEVAAQPTLTTEDVLAEGEALGVPDEAAADVTPADQPAAPAADLTAPVLPMPPVAAFPAAPASAVAMGNLAALPAVDDSCPTAPVGRSAFRDPLPTAPVWNPPGPKRVALQAGHWLNEQVPPELRGLQAGASGGGKQEWQVNLDIAQRTAQLLEAEGVEVDVLPTTVPERYRAHAFIAIHADGDLSGLLRGYKIARPGFSSIPETDDQLVEALYAAYGPATGLRRDDEHISMRMRYYYAFNSRRFCHAVATGVPQAIVETGFLTSAADRQLLLGNPDAAARGIADGVLAFLNSTARP